MSSDVAVKYVIIEVTRQTKKGLTHWLFIMEKSGKSTGRKCRLMGILKPIGCPPQKKTF